MKKRRRKYGLALALLVSLVIFIIELLTVSIAAVLVYILGSNGVIIGVGTDGAASMGETLLLMSIISVVLGAIITMATSKIYLRPFNRLISRINRLASGDFKARLSFGRPIGEHPTFRELADSFNTMARELESTEMLRADFINNFSHEFKTPIVSIAGFAKLLKKGNLTPQQQGEYLDIIEEESLRLADMATNVLNMTKVENQSILTGVETYNLSEQLRGCILLLIEGKWAKKNIDFSIEFFEHSITADEELLKHVWLNLLDNAIKFSPEGGTVTVGIRDVGSQLSVYITNRGKDIPEDKRERIFNKFYQAEESHSTEGNGVGLALVKKVTQLHRGSIRVDSGGGLTRFTVTLPKEQ